MSKYFIDSSKNIKVFFLRINSNKLTIKSKLQSFLNLQSFVKMTSYCLIPNLVLNLWANVALQFIITLISNFFSLKILLSYFIGFSTSSYLCFLWAEWYLIVISCKFYDLILLLCVFHLTRIFYHYLLLFLYHFLHSFFCLYQPYL